MRRFVTRHDVENCDLPDAQGLLRRFSSTADVIGLCKDLSVDISASNLYHSRFPVDY